MQTKKSEELLAEIYRNCQLALESISDILPACEHEDLKEEIERQHEEYEKVSAKASVLAKNLGYEIKEPNAIKKAMMWGSIKLNTLADNSRAKISEMLAQGTLMGITTLKTTLGEVEHRDGDEIQALAKELIDKEESFEKAYKSFIG